MIKKLAKEINDKWFRNNKNYIGFYGSVSESILALLTKKETLSEIEISLEHIILDNTFLCEDDLNNITFDVSDKEIILFFNGIDYYFILEEKFIY